MAVVEVKRAVPIVAPLVPAELEAAVAALFEPAKTVTVEPVAVAAGNSGKPLTRPEREYMVLVALLVVIGAVVGILLDDGKRMYSPPDGVSIFALFYIGAQAIERLLEPLASFYGTTAATGEQDSGKPGGLSGRLTKSQAVRLATGRWQNRTRPRRRRKRHGGKRSLSRSAATRRLCGRLLP
jgi:hypothetical protein